MLQKKQVMVVQSLVQPLLENHYGQKGFKTSKHWSLKQLRHWCSLALDWFHQVTVSWIIYSPCDLKAQVILCGTYQWRCGPKNSNLAMGMISYDDMEESAALVCDIRGDCLSFRSDSLDGGGKIWKTRHKTSVITMIRFVWGAWFRQPVHMCLHSPQRPPTVFLQVVLWSFTLVWGQMQLCSNKANWVSFSANKTLQGFFFL